MLIAENPRAGIPSCVCAFAQVYECTTHETKGNDYVELLSNLDFIHVQKEKFSA